MRKDCEIRARVTKTEKEFVQSEARRIYRDDNMASHYIRSLIVERMERDASSEDAGGEKKAPKKRGASGDDSPIGHVLAPTSGAKGRTGTKRRTVCCTDGR